MFSQARPGLDRRRLRKRVGELDVFVPAASQARVDHEGELLKFVGSDC
jgi:hypothetical protein